MSAMCYNYVAIILGLIVVVVLVWGVRTTAEEV